MSVVVLVVDEVAAVDSVGVADGAAEEGCAGGGALLVAKGACFGMIGCLVKEKPGGGGLGGALYKGRLGIAAVAGR